MPPLSAEPRLEHAADRLVVAVERHAAPVCVGIDPVVERVPGPTPRNPAAAATAIGDFTLAILDAVAGVVPCVKMQSACFERWGVEGVKILDRVMVEAASRQLLVILDAKRGDIGISAEHYAAAAFGTPEDPRPVDWVTVNPYLGADGIEPFLRGGRGVFALVRTSNPGGDAVQTPQLVGGGSVAEHVAGLVAGLGDGWRGRTGFSALGAVVGATKSEEMTRLRELMPHQVFLVPGLGAQGGRPEDTAACFCAGGRGAIVTASRSIIYAGAGQDDWTTAVRQAAQHLADDIGRVAGLR